MERNSDLLNLETTSFHMKKQFSLMSSVIKIESYFIVIAN